MRTRITFKATLAGSSDKRRIAAARVALSINHNEGKKYFDSINVDVEVEEVEITEEYLLRRYTEVMVFGTWCPLKKYVGRIVFMYETNYKMR